MPTIISLQAALEPTTCAQLSAAIAAGGMAAIPTESSYALAVSPFHEAALRRLFAAKGRPEHNPCLVLIGALTQLPTLVADIPPAADFLHRTFWPGPLTILFPVHHSLPGLLTAGTGAVGVRLPAMPQLCHLLAQVGPLTGTSANRSGYPPLCRVEDVQQAFGQHLDIVIDGGTTPGTAPSTIVDGREPIRVLREGAVPRAVLGEQLRRGKFELCS